MPGAPNVAVITEQELATPDRTVGAPAGAVEADADDRPGQPVLGHAARHVRVVVLHRHNPDGGRAGPLESVAAGRIVRVEIVDEPVRHDPKQPLIVFDGLDVRAVRLVVVEVAKVVARYHVPALTERDRGLEMPAERQRRARQWRPQPEAAGSLATGTPHGQDGTGDDADDRIVAAEVDRAVMREDEIGNPGQALQIPIVVDDQMPIDLGGKHIELYYTGPNHTDNSLVLLYPARRVLFAVLEIRIPSSREIRQLFQGSLALFDSRTARKNPQVNFFDLLFPVISELVDQTAGKITRMFPRHRAIHHLQSLSGNGGLWTLNAIGRQSGEIENLQHGHRSRAAL